jgi:N-glycosylase/DNA lyase
LRTRLTLPPRFSFDAVVRSHGWYNLSPFRYQPEAGGTLTTVLGGGEVSFRPRAGVLVVSGAGHDRAALRAAAVRIFSLDLDLSAFDGALDGEPDLRRALTRGGGRMLRAPSVFEDAVKMLLTTNCSWEATRGMVAKLVSLAGERGAAFPTPESLSKLSPATLRTKIRCGYRAGALSRFARRVASGRLDLSTWEDRSRPAAEVRESILAEHGFGPYAAEGLLRILGRHEFRAIDSWVRKQYRRLHPGPVRTVDRAIARRYARFGGFRGLAMWLELTRHWHEGDV